MLVAYCPELFVWRFPADVAGWKGKGTLCRERAPVPILGAVTPYHGIAMGIKGQTRKAHPPSHVWRLVGRGWGRVRWVFLSKAHRQAAVPGRNVGPRVAK